MSTNDAALTQTLAHERISSNDPFTRYGFLVAHNPGRTHFEETKRKFTDFISDSLAGYSGVASKLKRLEDYHNFIAEHQIDHHAFIKSAGRSLPASLLESEYLLGAIDFCQNYFGSKMKLYKNFGEFRVSRPNEQDFNPFHRDHWFGYFTPLLNLYLPIAGSWCDSAMQVVPKSHLWTDEQARPTFLAGQNKTEKDGIKFSVPTLEYCEYPLDAHCPDILPGDFMLFSPKMVHGNGINVSIETRFSFEIRLEFLD